MEYQSENYNFEIMLLPAEEGGYTVTVPMLPGCVTEGDSQEEAKQNAKEAIELYIETLEEDGMSVPQETEEILKVNLFIKKVIPKSYA